jgi:hypothetical protein
MALPGCGAAVVAVTSHGRRRRPPLASRRTGPSASLPVSSPCVLLGAAARWLFLFVDGGASARPPDVAAATVGPFAGDEHPPGTPIPSLPYLLCDTSTQTLA